MFSVRAFHTVFINSWTVKMYMIHNMYRYWVYFSLMFSLNVTKNHDSPEVHLLLTNQSKWSSHACMFWRANLLSQISFHCWKLLSSSSSFLHHLSDWCTLKLLQNHKRLGVFQSHKLVQYLYKCLCHNIWFM